MANSYADDIKVKISEKYKPPCRIGLPMSYSQRLTLNKQIQDSRPSYDFHLERSVLEKVRELKEIRRDMVEERKRRLDLARQEFDKKLEKEKEEKIKKEQAEAKPLEQSNEPTNVVLEEAVPPVPHSTQQGYINPSNTSQNYVIRNGILMPIPVSSYSINANSILEPSQTTAVKFEPPQSTSKTFNLSDFESDTSSPFDNMELKSINDLEELAQVLKSDRTNFQANLYSNTTPYQIPAANYANTNATRSYGNLPANMKNYSEFPQSSAAYGQQNPNAYNQNSLAYNQITNTSYNPVSSTFSNFNNPYASPSNYQVPTAASCYSNLNGYLYNIPSQMTSQIQLNNPYAPYVSTVTQPSLQKSNCKSVPDLVRTVETELENTHLNNTREASRHSLSNSYTTTNVPVPARPKSTDSVYLKAKIKEIPVNPLDKLPKEQREVCKNVSLMGFPLDRVVRVCDAVGCDQKKIIDHLLVLSELLDLGFSEKDASEALIRNNNDRDKALDFLIS